MTRLRRAAAVAACFMFGAGALARASQVTSFRLETVPGTPDDRALAVFLDTGLAKFRVETNYANGVFVDVSTLDFSSFYILNFVPPEGTPLVPGKYAGASPFPQGDPTKPRFSVSVSGCEAPTGSFEVLQIEYGAGGQLLSFWATFQVDCGALSPGLLGEIRLTADVPLVLSGPIRVGAIESRELLFDVTAVNDDAAPIVLAASGLPDGAEFSDRRDGTGEFLWTPTTSQFGAHTVSFMASDAAGRTDRVLTFIQVTVSNDSIDEAIRVDSLPFSATLDPLQATPDLGDPSCVGGGSTVWYRLNMPQETVIEIRVKDGDIGVYSGAPVDANQMACGRRAVRFTAVAGQDYAIVTDGSGAFLIDRLPPPPPNDDFDQATVVSALPFDETIDTRAATAAPDDPPICGDQCATVWYRYTPEESNAIGVTTWGSDYDTTVFVYTGTRGALELVQNLWPSYRLPVEAGRTYHFLVISGGMLRFSVTDQPPLSFEATLEPVALMDKPSGVITLRGEITCSLPAHVILGIGLERWLAERYLHAGGNLVMDCTGRTPFEVDVQTYSASRFGDSYPPGHYVASVYVNGFDTSRGEPAEASIYRFPILVRGAP